MSISKTLIIGNFRKGWDTSITDETHIADALRDMGHEVWRWQRDGDCDAPDDIDLIIIAQWNMYPVDFVSNLRKRNRQATIIYWAFDYQSLPRQEWHERLAKEVDIFLSKEMDNREEYLAMGANFKWLPQDFAPETLEPAAKRDKDIDVLFTGTYLPYAKERNKMLKAIDDRYNLKICSITPVEWKQAGFKDVMDVMVDDDLAEMVAKTKINISIDSVTDREGYWSDRNAQIMVCGGFVLFRYVPMSEIVFGDHIAYFFNKEEMMDQIDYYLRDEAFRNFMATEGKTYADKNLRVSNRVSQMIRIVKDYRGKK